MKLFLISFFLVTSALAEEPTVQHLTCTLQRPDNSTRFAITAELNQPIIVAGNDYITVSDGVTAKIDAKFDEEEIVSNRVAQCSRQFPSYSSELSCAWEPRGYNQMKSFLKVVPVFENGRFTGNYLGDAFISTHGRFGIDTRDLVITYRESLICQAR